MCEVCYWSCFNNTILGQSCHCLFLKKAEKLRHNLDRPSRSDFVQFELGKILFAEREKFQSCGEIDNNRRFEVVGLMNISIELLMTEQSMWRKNE